MKNLFINFAPYTCFKKHHPQHKLPPIDLGYCASILDANGFDTYLLDTAIESFDLKKFLLLTKKYKPDVLIIRTSTPTSKLALELAHKIKLEIEIPIIFLGQHASSYPQAFLFKNSPVDACIIGESELSLLDLLRNLKYKNKVNGIAYFSNNKIKFTRKRALIKNLNVLPFPKHGWFVNRYFSHHPVFSNERTKWGFILGSRGCTHKCIFCSPTLRNSFGNIWRGRDPKNIVKEMIFLSSKYKVNAIYFLDDAFTFNKKYVNGLCDEIIKQKLDIKFITQARVDEVNKKIIKKMKKAGFTTICFGVESGSQRILNLLRKDINIIQIKKAFKIVKEEGLFTVGFFLIGSPTETIEELNMTIKLMKEISPDMIQIAFFTPYPGSLAFEFFKSKLDKNFSNFSHYNEISMNMSEIPSNEIKKVQKKIYKNFYLNPNYFFKHQKYLNYLMKNIQNEIFLIKDTLNFLFKTQE